MITGWTTVQRFLAEVGGTVGVTALNRTPGILAVIRVINLCVGRVDHQDQQILADVLDFHIKMWITNLGFVMDLTCLQQ